MSSVLTRIIFTNSKLFFFRGLKSLFVFLIEQPSQLKYIEWPSFSNTVCLIRLCLFSVTNHNVLNDYLYIFMNPLQLRTAALTLVIVAFLLVALSSVDSALSYLLNLALRKSTQQCSIVHVTILLCKQFTYDACNLFRSILVSI